MKNKNIFLKNVLATASTLAITLISTDAMAAAPAAQLRVLTNAAPARLALDTTTGDLAGAQNNDALQLVQDGTTLEVIAAGGTSINKINGIDVNGKTGAQLEAGAQTFILGSVFNTVNN